MSTYLRRNTAVLLAVAAAIGVAILSFTAVAGGKDALLITLGIHSPKGSALADASCILPDERGDEVYFVSCGGFF